MLIQANALKPFVDKSVAVFFDPQQEQNPKIRNVKNNQKSKIITFLPMLFFGGKSKVPTVGSNFFKSVCNA